MKLLGDAAVAMWWKVAPENQAEFQEWHSKEHLPERLAIPGFNRGSRWQREEGDEFFVLYELSTYDVLTSDAYRARLNDPTPWSTKMMPLHRDMVRSQCRVVASSGRGLATFVSTIRLSPEKGREAALDVFLRNAVADLPRRAGVTAAHLLVTETPAASQTKEQLIRGGDAAADWIFLLSGYDGPALRDVCAAILDRQSLRESGAATVSYQELFRLVHAVTAQDL